jgi:Tol biopolymer transport system component
VAIWGGVYVTEIQEVVAMMKALLFVLVVGAAVALFPIGARGTVFTQLTDLAGQEAYPAWCGDFIYFNHDSSGVYAICRIPDTGGTHIHITDPAQWAQQPDLYAGCGWIVFSAFNGGNRNIYKQLSTPGNPRVQLTTDSGLEEFPAWSPDGSKIYYITRPLPAKLMNADGSNQHAIDNTGVEIIGGDWSPDGSRIMYGKKPPGGNFEIWIMNADGSDSHVLVSNPTADLSRPKWSPGGSWIVYMSQPPGNPPVNILVAPASGGPSVAITADSYTNPDPAWSPDGASIVFCSNRDGGRNLDLWIASDLPGPLAEIQATIDLDPNTLNLKSKGKYATCYIELPEEYDPEDIDVSTVMLNDAIPAELSPTRVGDYDSDGTPDRMVKFSRSELIALLAGIDGSSLWLTEKGHDVAPIQHGAEFEVVVGAELTDGTSLSGTDVIRVINPGGGARDRTGGATVPVKVHPTAVGGTPRISYELAAEGPVSLRIFDVAGRLMRTLEVGNKAAGTHTVTWDRRTGDGQIVGSGIYFIRLEQRGMANVQKLLILE